MEIGLGSTVECVDGADGHVGGLIIACDTKKLLGLVITRGRIVTEDIVIPMEIVRNADANKVYLRLTTRELGEEFHKLREIEYVPIGEDWKLPPPDSPEEAVLTSIPSIGSEPPLIPSLSDLKHPLLLSELTNIPEGAVDISGKTQIVCPDGPVAILERMLFDPTNNVATHLISRLQSASSLLVAIPIYLVSRLDENAIYLKARRSFIESLPASPQVGT